MSGFGGSVKLTGEASYKKALADITNNLKQVSAEMKATAGAYDAGDKSQKDVIKDSEAMKKSLQSQKDAIANLKQQIGTMTAEYEKTGQKHQALVKEYDAEKKKLDEIGKTLGTSSAEYKAQEKVVNDLAQEVTKSENAYNAQGKAIQDLKTKTANAEATMYKTAKAVDDLGKQAEETGDEAEESGKKWKSFGDIVKNAGTALVAGVGAIGTAVVGTGKKLFDMANDVSTAGDEIDKASQKLSISAENYQKLAYAMDMNGASIDDLSKGMKNITTSLAGAQNGVKGASDDFDKLGVSLKNTDGSFKSTEDVLLESIDALSQMEDETQRNALAQQIFGKSASELNPLLNAGSEGIHALMQEAEDYGMVMSQDAVNASATFNDSLTRMQGVFTGLKNNMIGQFMPSISSVMDGISDLASGVGDGSSKIKKGLGEVIKNFSNLIPRVTGLLTTLASTILENAPELIRSMAKGIMDAVPELVSTATEVMLELVNTLTSLLPDMLDMGIEILDSIISGIEKAIPTLIKLMPEIITNMITKLTSMIPQLVTTGVRLLTSLIDNMPAIVTGIVKALPTLISGLVSGLLKNIPEIVKAGVTLLTSLVKNLPQIIATIVKAVPEIIKGLVNGFKSGVGKMSGVGSDLVKGIWNGISNTTSWILSKIKGFGRSILNGVKSVFKIHSPSQLFEDEIGVNLAKGIGVGFEDEMKDVSAQMNDAIPTSFDTDISTGSSGGYFDMVGAFKQALQEVKIELDDETCGRFVDATVTKLIYT